MSPKRATISQNTIKENILQGIYACVGQNKTLLEYHCNIKLSHNEELQIKVKNSKKNIPKPPIILQLQY